MAILQAVYRYNAILIKLPINFSTELEQTNLKIYMEPQKTPRIAKEMLRKMTIPGIPSQASGSATKLL